MGHLREAVDNHKHIIMFLCRTWKPEHKSYIYILLRSNGNRQGDVKTNVMFFYA